MRDGEEQAVGRDRALQQVVRRARMRVAELVVGIAARADDVLLEARRHLVGWHDRAHFQAPRIVLQRLGGGAGERGADPRSHGACKNSAAPKQCAAIKETVAGNGFHRRSSAVTTLAHVSLPGGQAFSSCPSSRVSSVGSGEGARSHMPMLLLSATVVNWIVGNW